MVEKYLTEGLEQLGDDIEIVDVNATIRGLGRFAVPPGIDLSGHDEMVGRFGEYLIPRGGVYLDEFAIQISLKSNRSQPVYLTNISPELTGGRCSKPLEQGWGVVDNAAEGIATAIRFSTIVDAQNPTMTPIGFGKNEGPLIQKDYFGNGGMITLNLNEPDVLQIETRVNKGFCKFSFRVDYIGPDGRETMTIDNHGKPFEISSIVGLPNPSGAPGNYVWWLYHINDQCLTRDGKRARLTMEQIVHKESLPRGGGQHREYCAEVGVP